MAATTTTALGDLTAKDIRTVRTAFTELLALGKYDTDLDGIAEAVIARGDVIVGETKERQTAPKKTTPKKTDGRLPAAPAVAKKTATATEDTPAVVVGRNYTIPGDKFSGLVVKFLEPAKREGSGRFEVVVSENDAYPVGKVVVVPVAKVSPTRKGPRK